MSVLDLAIGDLNFVSVTEQYSEASVILSECRFRIVTFIEVLNWYK